MLIDGERPPSRTDSLSSILDRIPASSVQRIDLIRGGANGIDMQGRTIIANVIRKPSGGMQGSIAATLNADEFGGFFPYAQLQLQRRRDGRLLEGSLTVNADDFTVRARGDRVDPQGVLLRRFKNEGAGHDLSVASTGAYERELGKGQVRLNSRVEHHWSESGIPLRLNYPGGVETDYGRSHGTSGELGLRYGRPLTPRAAIELVAFQKLSDESYVDDYSTARFDAGTASLTRTGETIVDAKLKLPWSATWTFETGLESVYNFVDAGTAYTYNAVALDLSGNASRVEELRNEGFATAVWRPRPALSLEATLRFEHSTITADGTAGSARKTLSFPKPRLVMTWTPNPHHEVQLRAERTIDQLSFDSFSASASFSTGIYGVGNPDIEPGQIWTYEARYQYRFAQRGTALVQFTHEQLNNLLAPVSVLLTLPGQTTPQYFDIIRNLVDARRETLTVATDLPLDRAGLTGGLLALRSSWRTAPVRDPLTDVARDINNTQANEWSINLSQNIARLNLNWNIGASSGTNVVSFAPRQIVSVDNAYRLGAGVTWKPVPKLSLTAGANSINGGDNVSHVTIFDLPRGSGAPLYLAVGSPIYSEVSRGYNKTQVYVALRQSF